MLVEVNLVKSLLGVEDKTMEAMLVREMFYLDIREELGQSSNVIRFYNMVMGTKAWWNLWVLDKFQYYSLMEIKCKVKMQGDVLLRHCGVHVLPGH